MPSLFNYLFLFLFICLLIIVYNIALYYYFVLKHSVSRMLPYTQLDGDENGGLTGKDNGEDSSRDCAHKTL